MYSPHIFTVCMKLLTSSPSPTSLSPSPTSLSSSPSHAQVSVDVIELDPEILTVAEKWFGFVQGEGVTVCGG